MAGRRGAVAAVGSVLSGCATRMSYPFTLGVASGEPLPHGVVLWTRLAPDPLNGGGMPPRPVAVRWQVATDERFRRVVRSGSAVASPEHAHSVHVQVRGLAPATWYWYRFRAGSDISPSGRTRTAPAPGASSRRLRFAFASCQNFQHGFYPAYRDMASQDLDFVVHLGDYIYETGPHPVGPRIHEGGECITLEQYRNRYALYKTDPLLQSAHASFPFIATFDDHEVDDNYADAVAQAGAETSGRAQFLVRRASAYKAYWEHLPLGWRSQPRGPAIPLYRRFQFGRLVELNVLDTRQYRTDQPCGDGIKAMCASAMDPRATLTGARQESWLLHGLDRSGAAWNVLAQQTMLAEIHFREAAGELFSMDQWDGYRAARSRLLRALARRPEANAVVISGDTHASWMNELLTDFEDPDSERVGTEFVGPSISSECSTSFITRVQAALDDNPHIGFFDGAFRGYVRCDIDR